MKTERNHVWTMFKVRKIFAGYDQVPPINKALCFIMFQKYGFSSDLQHRSDGFPPSTLQNRPLAPFVLLQAFMGTRDFLPCGQTITNPVKLYIYENYPEETRGRLAAGHGDHGSIRPARISGEGGRGRRRGAGSRSHRRRTGNLQRRFHCSGRCIHNRGGQR